MKVHSLPGCCSSFLRFFLEPNHPEKKPALFFSSAFFFFFLKAAASYYNRDWSVSQRKTPFEANQPIFWSLAPKGKTVHFDATF